MTTPSVLSLSSDHIPQHWNHTKLTCTGIEIHYFQQQKQQISLYIIQHNYHSTFANAVLDGEQGTSGSSYLVYELKVVFKKCTTVLHVDRFGVEKKNQRGGGGQWKETHLPPPCKNSGFGPAVINRAITISLHEYFTCTIYQVKDEHKTMKLPLWTIIARKTFGEFVTQM